MLREWYEFPEEFERYYIGEQVVVIGRDADTSALTRETWRLHGKVHREGGPAYRTWHKNGVLESEEYLLHSLHHRTDGPAFCQWNEDGEVICEEYYISAECQSNTMRRWHGGERNSILHNPAGPALWHWDGDITKCHYYLRGVLHRRDGPALREWRGGRLYREEYYFRGMLHRLGGPAKSVWGAKNKSKYYLYGNKCPQ